MAILEQLRTLSLTTKLGQANKLLALSIIRKSVARSWHKDRWLPVSIIVSPLGELYGSTSPEATSQRTRDPYNSKAASHTTYEFCLA